MHERKRLSTDELLDGIRHRNRPALAQALTLVESKNPRDQEQAQELLSQILPVTDKSIRVGITGIPGSGKSSLIEVLGLHIIERGLRVAVLAIDPSSSLTGGSILGDKTRMEQLSRSPEAFIRPSPSGGSLGGVASRTREAMLICEAAGFEVILVETIGVGQSEIAVRSMVDFFLLLQISGGGDELQGIKKGVVELADAIYINKADGDNRVSAESAQRDLLAALHFLSPATDGWRVKVGICSALTNEGIDEIWQTICDFRLFTQKSGFFAKRRKQQARHWLHALLDERIRSLFLSEASVKTRLAELEAAVLADELTVSQAVDILMNAHRESRAVTDFG